MGTDKFRKALVAHSKRFHQLSIVDPHYEEWGIIGPALLDVDKEGPVKVETSWFRDTCRR